MEIKLFGKTLFTFHKDNTIFLQSGQQIAEHKFLPDFETLGSNLGNGGLVAWKNSAVITPPEPATLKKEKIPLSPKRVYEMKMLHDQGFQINMEPKYIDQQIADFKAKLLLIKNPSYDHRGIDEIGSIILRMENRKKYASVRQTFEKFPYTTRGRIANVLKKNDHLKLGEVTQFVADLPNEATSAMKEYNDATNKICKKKAVFYIIANKKDFEKTNTRRDPILLAQSPFGHFWQILGAWDEEMLLLEKL
jgi:hypothetical protein